jgi:hypothetical protein
LPAQAGLRINTGFGVSYMKKNRALHLSMSLFLLAFNLLLAGCETPFTPVKNVPPDKALVYLYRKYNTWGSGIGIKVFANGQPVTELTSGDPSKGTYYPYLCPPGDVLFTGRELGLGELALADFMYPTVPLTKMKVEAGKTYYLRLKWVNYHALTGSQPGLVQFDNAIGLQQITNCVLAKSYETTNSAGH